MIDLIIGITIGLVVGFIISVYVMRWAVSDLRENARRAIALKNESEEVIENLHEERRMRISEVELLLSQRRNMKMAIDRMRVEMDRLNQRSRDNSQ